MHTNTEDAGNRLVTARAEGRAEGIAFAKTCRNKKFLEAILEAETPETDGAAWNELVRALSMTKGETTITRNTESAARLFGFRSVYPTGFCRGYFAGVQKVAADRL